MLQWIIVFFGYRMAKSCDSGSAVVYFEKILYEDVSNETSFLEELS